MVMSLDAKKISRYKKCSTVTSMTESVRGGDPKHHEKAPWKMIANPLGLRTGGKQQWIEENSEISLMRSRPEHGLNDQRRRRRMFFCLKTIIFESAQSRSVFQTYSIILLLISVFPKVSKELNLK